MGTFCVRSAERLHFLINRHFARPRLLRFVEFEASGWLCIVDGSNKLMYFSIHDTFHVAAISLASERTLSGCPGPTSRRLTGSSFSDTRPRVSKHITNHSGAPPGQARASPDDVSLYRSGVCAFRIIMLRLASVRNNHNFIRVHLLYRCMFHQTSHHSIESINICVRRIPSGSGWCGWCVLPKLIDTLIPPLDSIMRVNINTETEYTIGNVMRCTYLFWWTHRMNVRRHYRRVTRYWRNTPCRSFISQVSIQIERVRNAVKTIKSIDDIILRYCHKTNIHGRSMPFGWLHSQYVFGQRYNM